MSAGSGGYGLARRIVSTTPLSSEGRPLERSMATSSNRPSRAIVTRVNTVPPFLAQQGSLALTLAFKLTDQNETHTVSYATEAGLFQDGGAPSIVCGPGDIAQAHTADEWLELDQLERARRMLVEFLHSLP